MHGVIAEEARTEEQVPRALFLPIDGGVGNGDYVEQITYLIFLKMADEREKAGQQVQVPIKYAWAKLAKLDGDDLELQYRHTLENLSKQGGMLGTIFRKAQIKH